MVCLHTPSSNVGWPQVTEALVKQKLHIIAAAKARQFSTSGCSHTQPSSYDDNLQQCVNSYSRWALQIQKRRDGTHHDAEIHVFFSNLLPPVSVNLNMYSLTIYNHMDVINVFKILTHHTSRKVTKLILFALNSINISKQRTLSDSLTREGGSCFVGEGSMKTQSLWFFF